MAQIRRERAAGRRGRDAAMAASALAAACEAAGLRPRDVQRRPKLPAHSQARRAAAMALAEAGWSPHRVLRILRVSEDQRRAPTIEMVEAAREAVRLAVDEHRRELRSMAEAVYTCRVGRSALIRAIDQTGVEAHALCEAIGIDESTLCKWRGMPRLAAAC